MTGLTEPPGQNADLRAGNQNNTLNSGPEGTQVDIDLGLQ